MNGCVRMMPGESPSEHARETVGKTVFYTSGDKPRREAIVTDVRATGTRIENVESNESWPGIQFKMEPTDGSTPFWSDTFPDRGV